MPWAGKSVQKIMSLVLKGKRPSFEAPQPPARFKALIESCWSQEVKNRPNITSVFRVSLRRKTKQSNNHELN